MEGWLVQGQAAESLEQRLDVYEKTTASRYKESGEKPMIFAMDDGKQELFPGVMAGGVLPRKTFSMGHACGKEILY
ncbi:hypothetical protein [Anaerostipes faecalis]|uniref:hypothetical protein n=1 Tax=Anaerostipes faecalis TaxID=2738446 RepID=UPI001C1E76DE|nr:hypothetical protein [Anaerostipes faecalis]